MSDNNKKSIEQTPVSTKGNSPRRVLFASLIGTTIEFFDFYIYGTAAVLVFPFLFFPGDNAATATLQSLATFALAFFARPLGSALFGHYGDRIGRKATLVAALLTMGISTVVIASAESAADCLPAKRKISSPAKGSSCITAKIGKESCVCQASTCIRIRPTGLTG